MIRMKSVGLDPVLEAAGLNDAVGLNSEPVGDKDKLIMIISY